MIHNELALWPTSAEIAMAFKCQVLDTADSANIQQVGPDCACAINIDMLHAWRKQYLES